MEPFEKEKSRQPRPFPGPFKGNPDLGFSWVPFKGTQGDPGGQGGQEGLFWAILAPLARPLDSL